MRRGAKPGQGMRYDYQMMPTRPIDEFYDNGKITRIVEEIVRIITAAKARRLAYGMRTMGFDAVED